ncbi:GIY-YIG nuclease family protein [Xanthomonas citri]
MFSRWVRCSVQSNDGIHIYAGITNDIARRYRAHASGNGARFTRARPPLRVVAMKPYPDRPAALRAEWAVKRLPRARKLAFFTGAI